MCFIWIYFLRGFRGPVALRFVGQAGSAAERGQLSHLLRRSVHRAVRLHRNTCYGVDFGRLRRTLSVRWSGRHGTSQSIQSKIFSSCEQFSLSNFSSVSVCADSKLTSKFNLTLFLSSSFPLWFTWTLKDLGWYFSCRIWDFWAVGAFCCSCPCMKTK